MERKEEEEDVGEEEKTRGRKGGRNSLLSCEGWDDAIVL